MFTLKPDTSVKRFKSKDNWITFVIDSINVMTQAVV